MEVLLARERIQAPMLKYEQIKYFLERFTNGDVNDQNYRQSLVDTFINRIELFNEGMEIIYNAHDGQNNVPLGEQRAGIASSLEGSPKGRMVELSKKYNQPDLTVNVPQSS